MFRLKRLTF